MIYAVEDCLACHGNFCCSSIIVNTGRKDIPIYFQRINGKDLLGYNPFLPLHEHLQVSEGALDYFKCKNLDGKGLCAIHKDRPDMCKNYPSPHIDDLLDFRFSCPWCAYRVEQTILRQEDYTIAPLKECMQFYCDPTEEHFQPSGTLDDCFRFSRNFWPERRPTWTSITEVNDFFKMEVLASYRVHFAVEFGRVDFKMNAARNAFSTIAVLCYEFGITPTMMMNIAALYGRHHASVKTDLPFPTYLIGAHFKSFLKERVDRIRDRAKEEKI